MPKIEFILIDEPPLRWVALIDYATTYESIVHYSDGRFYHNVDGFDRDIVSITSVGDELLFVLQAGRTIALTPPPVAVG